MRRSLQFLILSIVLTSSLSAQLFQARVVTSAYAWQRQDTVGSASDHLFGHTSLSLSLAGSDLSFHAYGNGFTDLSGPVKEESRYRLYNMYLKWSNLFDMASVSVGRQMVFAGVGNGTIDGGLASLKFMDSRIKVLGYYGALPPPGSRAEMIGDKTNNFMAGAQVVAEPLDAARFSISYMNRNIQAEPYSAYRRDSLFNPYLVEIKPTASSERYLSGDVNVEYDNFISGYARYDYDFDTEKMARAQFFTRVKVMESLGLTGEYLQREPRVSYNSIFSVFTFNTLTEYEVGAEYALLPSWQVFGKYGSVDYGDGETSDRVTLGVSGKYVSVSLARNVGYAGELSAASANIAYPLLENKVTPSLLVSYAKYKLSESASKLDDALSAAIGVVYRPLPVLSLDTQVQWIQNSIYQRDVRLFVRGSFLVSERLNIF